MEAATFVLATAAAGTRVIDSGFAGGGGGKRGGFVEVGFPRVQVIEGFFGPPRRNQREEFFGEVKVFGFDASQPRDHRKDDIDDLALVDEVHREGEDERKSDLAGDIFGGGEAGLEVVGEEEEGTSGEESAFFQGDGVKEARGEEFEPRGRHLAVKTEIPHVFEPGRGKEELDDLFAELAVPESDAQKAEGRHRVEEAGGDGEGGFEGGEEGLADFSDGPEGAAGVGKAALAEGRPEESPKLEPKVFGGLDSGE